MSYESKSLFQSNINLLNHSKDRHVFPHSQAYVRIFYMLKGIRSRIKDTFDSLSEIIATTKFDNINERKLFMSLIKEVNSLLTCTFGTLYPISNEVVQNIHQLLLDETLNSKNAISIKFSKEAMKALKAVLVITRIFTLIQVGKEFTSIKSPDTEAPFKSTTNSCKNVERSEYSGFSRLKAFNSSVHNKARKQLPFSSDNEDDDYMTIVCRICDKRVRADLIEQHTFSCMNAYRSETKVQSINNIILEIQKNFIKDYLSEEWPGPRQKSVSETIPLLHASILLNRAFEIDPFNVDSADELSVISETLQMFTNYNLPNEIICEIVQLKRKVIEKRCACNAIAHASEIMKQTRVDNTGEPDFAIKTTISDFQFIKRISSGAFARVYLAKKKATGDIYAIKVQPKDDVIQKNQVKRVMAEKNILLKFNNPYIINFCM
ncbi:hypothetical protein TRFO_04199 [Tritrichomonas foetus]|uniref:non-specific serine/threonine protein kinase n=1 Tax=Tritrichomonas foetus TaxID=1144522 RepID=A0A1J4KHK3_9EUKA|nr:hypothetical protein TRFO_04199 [Tritrichomonas foetus]|eukprot:OHT10683.1 hypothetical protein TRFO_04199 [Tritrichomonas foetus]